MRLPNGFGSVYKLSGKNRRNPYVAKKTCGWNLDLDTGKVKQTYVVIGYYPTRKEALTALAEYNTNPYDVNVKNMTLEDVYREWSGEHYPLVSAATVKQYRAVWPLCADIAQMRFSDIKLHHLQTVVDHSNRNRPTLLIFKAVLSMLYKYAIIHEIVPKEKNMVEYLNISKAGNPNSIQRQPFTEAEITKLWDRLDSDPYSNIVLMLIYTGCRISELLDLKKADVHLADRYFNVTHAKTSSGVRSVPIANKVLPFFENWYARNDCDFLLCTDFGKKMNYQNYHIHHWIPLMENLGMEHRPHDTRHTCISLLATAGVPDKIIKKIVGHSGKDVTESVYTHFEIQTLIEAIDKI